MQYTKINGFHGEIFAAPRPNQEELNRFYREIYFRAGVSSTYVPQYTEDEIAQKRLRAGLTVEVMIQALADGVKNPRLLEIGCGEGFVLSAALERGLDVKGVDYQAEPVKTFNPVAAPHIVATDPNVFLAELSKSQERFDGVILQNVLEHVLEPGDLLNKLRAVVADDGALIVQVPNDYSSLQKYAAEKGRIRSETWFCPPQHLNYWNNENIGSYLAAHGFDVIDCLSDFPVEIFLWGGESNYNKDPALGPAAHKARVDLDLFAARAGMANYINLYRALYQVGLGRNLVVVARRSRNTPALSVESGQ